MSFDRLLLAWLLVSVVTGSGCASARPRGTVDGEFVPDGGRDVVRVALLHGATSLDFEALSGVRVRTPQGDRAQRAGLFRARVRGGRVELITPDRKAIASARRVVLRSSASTPWIVGGDRFAGTLEVRRQENGTLTLINELPIETYLRGVVPWEIGRPDDDAREAVVAQAIAARTYTYARLGRWDDLGFDVYADTRDQVYRGLSGTAPICDTAIDRSTYRVAVRDGRLIRAYYSSTGGGHTSTLTDVWTRDGAPYLVGRRDVDAAGRSWCADSPHFRWTEVWSARELGDVVRKHLPEELDRTLEPEAIGVMRGLRVVDRDRSGRVRRLVIDTDRESFELWGDRIRWVLRPVESRFGILRSTMFDVENVVRDGLLVGVVLRGGGFGHGVGLCQTGALARARAGQDAETILRAYYLGVGVRDIRDLDRRGLAR